MSATLVSPITGEPLAAQKLGSMPMADYLALPGVGSSALRKLATGTPLEYAHDRANPRPSSPAEALGSSIHTAILEPESFAERYVVGQKFDKRKKGQKEAEAEFLADCEAKGLESLTKDQWDIALETSACLKAKGKLIDILRKGVPEHVYRSTDPETGVLCKVRPDWIGTVGSGVFAWDLKSARALDDRSIERAVLDHGYDQQAAFYLDVTGASEPDLVPLWHILWVLNTSPVDMRVTRLDQAWIERGRRLNRQALETLAACEASGHWPGHPNRITELGMPGWLRKQEGIGR